MELLEHISLRPYNTFGIDASARYFSTFSNTNQLTELLQANLFTQEPPLVLGGGSNVLISGDQRRLVLKNEVRGIQQVNEDVSSVYLKVGAGENWHQFVMHCIDHGYAGVENLSLIPGSVGASPLQNIGAYGVELKDVFHELTAYRLADGALIKFDLEDCAFGYRESVFKRALRGRFIIMDVTFTLSKQPHYNTTYGAIEQELERMGVQELTIRAVSQAVINIRQSKLPDPAVTGNAGSFFKNPEVSSVEYDRLKSQFPAIVGYPNAQGQVKIAAGWLIEQCGWKGYRDGDAGCHARQALVLVNYGKATGEEILALAKKIIDSVHAKFGVLLEREVNVV